MGKGSSDVRAAASTSAAAASSCSNNDDDLPSMIVFDLDDCLWTPEMHELSGMPSIPVEGPLDPTDNNSQLGTVGMKVPSRRRRGNNKGFDWGGYANDGEEEVVELYPEARLVLRELATNPKYAAVKIAVASSSLEPSYSRACINGIEIVDGVTMKDLISFSQIGREGQLTSRKTSHFKLLHEQSGIPYDEMIFFDDCNWGDHVGDLQDAFGVVGVRTPNGLQLDEFHHGLKKYKNRRK
jgi:magnesium-dependent phosphatase 1